nr:hypothetical protein [Tanacetum cinerariifolium]
MKKLKKNVHAIQVGCQIYRGAHLDKECPRNEEVKRVEEVKYGEFRRPSPFSIRAKYHVGPPRYYTRIDNCPYFVEKKPSLEELMNKHLKESTKEELRWKSGTVSEVNNSSLDQCKAVYDNKKAPLNNEINEPREVSFFSDNRTLEIQEEGISSKIFSCQLPPKELNPGHFTLPSSIGSLNFYAMADLGASINVIPKSMFEHLKLARLKKTDILVEMAYMTKRAVIGIVENVLIKINKFLFPSDFVVIYMLKIRNKTVILRRPFFATIHAEIDGFNKESSLGIGDDRVTFDMNKKVNNFTTQYGETHGNDLILDKRYAEWCNENLSPETPTSKFTSIQEDYKPRPKDYPFKDCLLTKVGHCSDEYELGIGKKGHMLDDIGENCKKVQGDNTYWWYDQKSEEEESREMGTNIEGFSQQGIGIRCLLGSLSYGK